MIHLKPLPVLLLSLPLLLAGAGHAYANDDTQEALNLLTGTDEQLVTTSRSPRPISRIAENVTVITAEDILRINAHTLPDVLQTVPGIQFDYNRTPGSFAYFNTQGANYGTTLVLVDGIRQNDFDQMIARPELIPIQQIERIEIIKGAASTAWGPALGGIINIVTKEPDPDRPIAGTVSGSVGSRFTADSRGEASGTLSNFGYYLSAGNLHSDGLAVNNGVNLNNVFGKLTYNLPGNGTATLSLSHLNGGGGMDEANTVNWGFIHDNYEARNSYGYLRLRQPLGHKLTLEIDGFFTRQDNQTKFGGADAQGTITFFNNYHMQEWSRGTSSRLTWGDHQKSLTSGIEYARDHTDYQDDLNPAPSFNDRTWDRWAVYTNGSYIFGPLTILPGLRYDHTGLADNKLSYTVGATWKLAESTVLRVYGAEGYALPIARANYASEKLQDVWTIQGGVETGDLPYLWLKGTYFYNRLKNSESAGTTTVTDQARQGFELDLRTVPLYGVSVGCGYTYTYVRDTIAGRMLQTDSNQTVPPNTVKLAFRYDNPMVGLHARLLGNYVAWNAAAAQPARDGGMVWDLHLNWKIFPEHDLSPELFFSGRNLFDCKQTTNDDIYTNAQQWFDGGVRFKF